MLSAHSFAHNEILQNIESKIKQIYPYKSTAPKLPSKIQELKSFKQPSND